MNFRCQFFDDGFKIHGEHLLINAYDSIFGIDFWDSFWYFVTILLNFQGRLNSYYAYSNGVSMHS